MSTYPTVKRGAPSRFVHQQITSATPQPELAIKHDLFPSGYEPIGLVAEGGVTSLWHARCRCTGVSVALKCLREEWRGNATALRLLQREVEVGRSVKSAHLLRIIDADVDSNAAPPWIASEWIEGSSLSIILQHQPCLSISRALWIARQSAIGLLHLQEHDISHGDLQPDNILLSSAGAVKLVNLCCSQPLHVTDDQGLHDGNEMQTHSSNLFRAPERQSGHCDIHITQDIYSLGVVLFLMLTGRLPFTNQTEVHDQQKFYSPMLGHFRLDASPELNNLVNRILAPQPVRRPQTADELIRELLEAEVQALATQLA